MTAARSWPWDRPLAQEPAPWMADAACAEVPVESLDFMRDRPQGDTPQDWDAYLKACAAVCRRCLVRGECRSFARRHSLTAGVWGGVVFMTNGRRLEVAA